MKMNEFLAKLASDKTLAGKMAKAANPDNAYAIAKAAGLTETFEAFTAAMKKLNEAAGEINADEADKITGGALVSVTVVVPDDGVPNLATTASTAI